MRDFRHPRRSIIRHGCSDAPGIYHLGASRPQAAAPFISCGGVPTTAAEDLLAPTHAPATVVTLTSGNGAVPENGGVRFQASATTPSRTVAVS